MTENYYRLVTILVNICPRPLRELFLKHAAADTNLSTPYTTLDAYLAFRKNDIIQLSQKPKCLLRKDQVKLLFPSQGQADINGWDVTLLSVLLKSLFQISPRDLTNIENIRQIRNDLQHIAGTCAISEQQFKNTFKQLRVDTIGLASSVNGQVYADQIQDDIAIVETSVLTNLGDVLRDWYMTKISALEAEIHNLKDQIGEIKSDTGHTIKTLNKTTEKRIRSGGKITKRLKTVDHIIGNMRRNFRNFFRNKLDSDFQAPPEMARITKELADNHLVVVSGYGKGLYLQAALSSINNQEYDISECLLISNPSDWRHIGVEDAELVVFLHPFGEKSLDLDMAKSMHAMMDSIRETATIQDNEEIIDIVIITDQSILEEWKQHFSHDMVENPITVYKPTTADSPVDLSEGDNKVTHVEADPHYKNILVQSIAYYKHHNAQMVEDTLKDEALELFRSKKVIVISGSRGNGKTTLALSLLSPYQDGHYLILTEPEDLSCIRFGITCVVVIEDLGGRYTLDTSAIQKWLRKFDMLYTAVKEGKLNVIITCLTERLGLCVEQSKHPMLDTVLEMPKLCKVKIKKESSSDYDIVNIPSRVNDHSTSPLYTKVKAIQKHDDVLPKGYYFQVIRSCCQHSDGFIRSCCQHPDGSFLVLTPGLNSKCLVHSISSDFEYKYTCNIDISDDDIVYTACTDAGDVIVTSRRQIGLYRISSRTLNLVKSTVLKFTVSKMRVHRNRILCYSTDGSLTKLDTNLNIKRKITLRGIRYLDHSPNILHVLSSHEHVFVDAYTKTIFNEDTILKQIKYLSMEDFHPYCGCAATEDSMFVLGIQRQNRHIRILQVNSDMAVLSDILTTEEIVDVEDISEQYLFFQRSKNRLVFSYSTLNDELLFIEIHLE